MVFLMPPKPGSKRKQAWNKSSRVLSRLLRNRTRVWQSKNSWRLQRRELQNHTQEVSNSAWDASQETNIHTEPNNPVRNTLAQAVQVMATPSRNRQKNVYGRLPPPSTKLPPADLEEIPPSSGLRAPDSLIKAGAASIPLRDEYPTIVRHNELPFVDQTPTRGSSKLTNTLRNPTHVLNSIAHTPTRGPSRLTDPLRDSAAKGTNELCNLLDHPTRLDQGLGSTSQSFGKSQVSELLPSWSLEVRETPSKGPPSIQSDFDFGERPQEISVKAASTKESSEILWQETPIKPAGATKTSPEGIGRPVAPAVTTSPEELGPSIYQSLGWDEVDELTDT